MKRTKFAALLSVCMVPAMFWSSESQAIPSWARKYNVSCYMCHSGMPQRNAVGEAFKNNGYRMPGGADEAFAKQKNIKIGNDEWKKGPNTPVASSFPQFDPLSVVLQGNIINYKAASFTSTGVLSKQEEFTLNAPNTGFLFFGATIGDNLSVFGDFGGFGGATVEGTTVDTQVTGNIRAVYQISPGFNFALGNSYSSVNWNGTGAGGVANVSGVLPNPGNYAEINYTRGEKGGYSIVAGTSMGAKTTTPVIATENRPDDILYLRGKVKIFGAGLLSGANGDLGNAFNGLDNQLTVGAGLSYTKNATGGAPVGGITATKGFTGNFGGETLVYGGDVQFVHNDILVGAAVSRDRDLKLENYRVEAGSFVYPWLFAKISYTDISNAGKINLYDEHQPTIVPSVSWWLAPNVSLTGTYTYFTKDRSVNPTTGATNQNTFALAVRAGF